MKRRAGMSEVKFKVRHNALLLREFTVADMVRATGLNPESVRTELQRMKLEGFLTSCPHPDKPKKRGGRPVLYQLTDDPEVRLALSESIEAFYPPSPPVDRPTSRHYLLAQQLLNRAQAAEVPLRDRLLSDAESHLRMAEQAEGGALAPKRIQAYLRYERARLFYLRGKHKEAREDFESLHRFFVEVRDEMMIGRIDESLLCLKAWDCFATGMPYGVGEAALARCLLDTMTEETYQTDSPLTSLLIRLVRQLSRTADERVRAAAFDLTRVNQSETMITLGKIMTKLYQLTGDELSDLEVDNLFNRGRIK